MANPYQNHFGGTMSNTSGGGVSFLGLLGITFIALKLGSVIDWSWWWVLLPIYGPFILVAIFLIVYVGFHMTKGKK